MAWQNKEMPPHALSRINKRGVPVVSLLLSAIATSLGILVNYLLPDQALELLMALVVTTLVLNWII